jgi:hypothetical protein
MNPKAFRVSSASDRQLDISGVLSWCNTASQVSRIGRSKNDKMKDPDHTQAVGGSEGSPEENVTVVDQRAFRDGYEPAAGDVFIAILGVTGAGKVVLLRCLSAHSC